MKSFTSFAAIATLTALSAAQSSTTTAASSVSASAAAAPTKVTDCYLHGETPYCFAGEDEWELETDADADALADAYTDCHPHDDGKIHCDSPEEVTFLAATAEADDDHSSSNSTTTTTEEIIEVTGCHAHDDTLFCFVGEDEWEVEDDVDVNSAPDAYTDCHAHGADELHCSSPEEVTLAAMTEHADDHADGEEDHTHTTTSSGETTTETQAAGNLASGTEISGTLVMLGAAVAALCMY